MVSCFRPQPTTTALSVLDKSDVTKSCNSVMALPVEMAGVPNDVSVGGDGDAHNEVRDRDSAEVLSKDAPSGRKHRIEGSKDPDPDPQKKI